MSRVQFVDVTLRDAHQSLWATRMTTAMMLPIAHRMDEAGFFIIDLVGGAVFDVCVRYLLENPWERMRIMASTIRKTPLNVMFRGQSLFTFELFPDDIVELTVRVIARTGVRSVMIFDALNDMRNLEVSIQTAKEEGLYTIGCVVYTLSPVHTDDYYAVRARQLAAMGVDAVMIKDPSGLLTPERVRTLVPALKAGIGGVPLQLHSHCLTGLAPVCYYEALRLGVDAVHTAISPLALGASLPPTESVLQYARRLGLETDLDEAALNDIAEYFRYVAERERKPLGAPAEYDPFHYEHHVPGGMISNLRSQLREVGLEQRLQEILEETARVRKELGYPIMVSPFAQFLVTQAVLNVVEGERYRTVPDEIRKYVMGYYGELAAPVDPNVLDRINPKGEFVRERAGALLEPAIPRLLREEGPFDSDEELLLAAYYPTQVRARLKEAGPIRTEYLASPNSLVTLLREVSLRREIRFLDIRKGNTVVRVSR